MDDDEGVGEFELDQTGRREGRSFPTDEPSHLNKFMLSSIPMRQDDDPESDVQSCSQLVTSLARAAGACPSPPFPPILEEIRYPTSRRILL